MAKIYTRRGDGGQTRLFTGERFPKTKAAWRLLGVLTSWSHSWGFRDQKLRIAKFVRG